MPVIAVAEETEIAAPLNGVLLSWNTVSLQLKESCGLRGLWEWEIPGSSSLEIWTAERRKCENLETVMESWTEHVEEKKAGVLPKLMDSRPN
jgi:hypothetical protein